MARPALGGTEGGGGVIILGINAYHAEASATLLRDGELVAAVEEERFSRIKHVAGFPTEAIRYCLREAGIRPEEIDAIALSRNPGTHLVAKGMRALRQGLFAPSIRGRLPLLQEIRNLRGSVAKTLDCDPTKIRASVHCVEHHRAHIASSYYPSGWDSSVILSLDGFGDFLSGMWGTGRGNRLEVRGEAPFPHSLGILYTAVTQFLGFTAWGDEYKVMGLAAYGRPDKFRPAFEKLLQETPRRLGYKLPLEYFRHQTAEGVPMAWASGAPSLETLFSSRIEELLGPPRQPNGPMADQHADIAAALQERLEAVVLSLLRKLGTHYRTPRLCYAGGVALNCSLNGKISSETPFQEIFIQPAAHDAGTSLGAALYVAHHIHGQPRRFVMKHAAWGPATQGAGCRQALLEKRLPFREMDETVLCRTAAEALSGGKIVGWFQGRMEFGPRSLGHRSLLADPRDPKMKDYINEKIKRRETFRPFAPSLIREAVPAYFPGGHPDPFMLFAYPVAQEKGPLIPAAVHHDGTGRLQSVDAQADPLFWSLLKEFEKRSGIPVLLNTSFNEQEPIVCRPEEAVACFQRNAIDCLALGPYWVERPKNE